MCGLVRRQTVAFRAGARLHHSTPRVTQGLGLRLVTRSLYQLRASRVPHPAGARWLPACLGARARARPRRWERLGSAVPGSGGRGRTRPGSRRVRAGSGASAVPAVGFGPPEPPIPAHSAGKFCGLFCELHRELREGREGKPRAARGSGSPTTSQGCGYLEPGEVPTPGARPLCARPGARCAPRGFQLPLGIAGERAVLSPTKLPEQRSRTFAAS